VRLHQSAVRSLMNYLPTRDISCDRFIHRTSGTLILLRCGHGALLVWLPTGERLVEGCDAHAVCVHIPGQLPNEVLRPGGTR
jgi:hypothetical protein